MKVLPFPEVLLKSFLEVGLSGNDKARLEKDFGELFDEKHFIYNNDILISLISSRSKEGYAFPKTLEESISNLTYSEELAIQISDKLKQKPEKVELYSPIVFYLIMAKYNKCITTNTFLNNNVFFQLIPYLFHSRYALTAGEVFFFEFEFTFINDQKEVLNKNRDIIMDAIKRLERKDVLYKLMSSVNLDKEFIMGVIKAIKHSPQLINSSQNFILITSIKPLISEIPLIALEFIAQLPSPMDNLTAQVFAKDVVPYIRLALVNQNIELAKPNGEHQIFNMRSSVESIFCLSRKETLPGGFTPVDFSFPDITPLSKFVDSESYRYIELLNQIVEKCSTILPTVIENLFENMEHCNEKDIILYMYIILDMVADSKPMKKIDLLAPKFYCEAIFDPNVTFFSHSGDFELLHTMRYLAMEKILRDDGDTLIKMIQTFAPYPLMTAEFWLRMARMIDQIYSLIQTNPKLIKAIITVVIFYQDLEFKHLTEDCIEEIRKARKALFTFLAHLMHDNSLLSVLFNDQAFMNGFISFVFEYPLKPFVLEKVKMYIMLSDSLKEFPTALFNVMNLICHEIPSESYMDLLLEFISAITSGLASRQPAKVRDIASELSLFITLLPQILMKIEKHEKAKPLLMQIMKLYVFVSPVHQMTDLDVDSIIYAFERIDDPEFSEQSYMQFIQLLSGDFTPSISPSFVIQQPQITKALLQCIKSKAGLLKLLDFLLDLCKFSPANAKILSECSIDEFLISFLENAKTTQELSNQALDSFLALFSILSSIKSSMPSVLSFISLLAPLDDTHVCKYHQQFFDALNKIVGDSSKQPKSYILLNGESKLLPPVKLPNLKTEGFTFTLWLYIDQFYSDYKPPIISILFDKDQRFGLFTSNKTLFWVQNDYDTETTGKLCDNMQIQHWYFIGVTYKRSKTRAMISFCRDCQCADIITVPITSLPDDAKPCAILIGGETITVPNPVRVTNLCIFNNLSDDDYINIFESGIRMSMKYPKEPLLFVQDLGKAHAKPTGFLDVLINDCGIETFLPLFSSSSLYFSDGTPYTFQFDSALMLLSSILLYSSDAQRMFAKAHGFYILLELLQKHWMNQITFKTYSHICGLLTSLEVEELQEQLFEAIITNFKFLIKLDDSIHMKILRYWERQLFESVQPLAKKLCGIPQLLVAISKYYYINKSDPLERIQRSETLDAGSCRGIIYHIMLHRYILPDGFAQEDFNDICGFAYANTEMELTKEALLFLRGLIEGSPQCFNFKLDNNDFIVLVSYYMQFPLPDLQQLALSLLFSACKSGLVNRTFVYDFSHSLIMEIPKELYNEDLFEYLKNEVSEEQSAMPLFVYSSIVLGKEEEAVQLIEAEGIARHNEMWALWPLILHSTVKMQLRGMIESKIAMVAQNDIYGLFSQIEFYFEEYPEYRKVLENNFIVRFLEYDELFDEMMEVCSHIFFFGPKCNSISLYENPFEEIPKQEISDYPTVSGIIKRLQSNGFHPNLAFSMQFTKEGVWSHIEAAVCLLNAFEKHQKSEYLALDLISASILSRNDIIDVMEHVKRMSGLEFDRNHNSDALVYVQYCMAMHDEVKIENIATPFISSSSFKRIIKSLNPQQYNHSLLSGFSSIFASFKQSSKYMQVISGIDIHTAASHLNQANKKQRRKSEQIDEFANKGWKKLWYDLSIERGPWYRKDDESEKEEWVLDPIHCAFGIRMKFTQDPLKPPEDIYEDNIIAEFPCTIISINWKAPGLLELRNSSLTIRSADTVTYSLSSISSVKIRYIDGEMNGCEIFSVNGFSTLIEITDRPILQVVTAIGMLHPYGPVQILDRLSECANFSKTGDWITGTISNFEYIMWLNNIYGRTFNSLDNYPIFPSRSFEDPKPDAKSVLRKLRRIKPYSEFPEELCATEDNNTFEIPEAFCMPEVCEGGMEEVVENRKWLESPETTEVIHKWIDKAFKELYIENHPNRILPVKASSIKDVIVFQPIVPPIITASVVEVNPLEFDFHLVTKSGESYSGKMRATKPKKLQQSQSDVSVATLRRRRGLSMYAKYPEITQEPEQENFLSMNTVPIFDGPSIVQVLDLKRFVVVSNDSHIVSVVDSEKSNVSFRHDFGMQEVTCIASDGPLVAVGCSNATTSIFRGGHLIDTIRLYKAAIISVAASEAFHAVVSGTKDGSLIICESQTGAISRVIDLGDGLTPSRILVTPTLGLVAALCAGSDRGAVKGEVVVHTINGLFVGRTVINSSINYMAAFTSRCGLDFLVLATRGGKISAIDAATLRPLFLPFNTRAAVAAIHFSRESGVLIVATQSGELRVTPIEIE